MKKFLSGLIFSAMAFALNAQSFQTGNIVAGLGGGLAIYHTTITDKTNPPYVSNDDTSGAWVFPLTVEYAALDWLGIGARLSYSNYIVNKDSVNITEKARGIDFFPFVNLHFLRANHIDMYASLEYGYSDFKYVVSQATNFAYTATAKGSGTGYSFGLNSRFYFGSSARVGLHVRFAWEGYHYNNGTFLDNNGAVAGTFELKAMGKAFGLGLQYRISE